LRFLILALVFAASMSRAQPVDLPDKVVLATTDWCPYSCADLQRSGGRKGIVVEYLEDVFEGLGIELEVQFYPWSRALMLARRGEHVHGLVSSVPSEVQGMLFTQVPTMSYRTCVFTLDSSSWRYESMQSLIELNLGYIQDYGYGGEVDDYIFMNKGRPNMLAITGNGGVVRLSRLLKAGRIDGFVSDPLVAVYEMGGVDHKLNMSACFEEFPFFLPLNPKLPWAQALINHLDGVFREETSQIILDGMVAEYLSREVQE